MAASVKMRRASHTSTEKPQYQASVIIFTFNSVISVQQIDAMNLFRMACCARVQVCATAILPTPYFFALPDNSLIE